MNETAFPTIINLFQSVMVLNCLLLLNDFSKNPFSTCMSKIQRHYWSGYHTTNCWSTAKVLSVVFPNIRIYQKGTFKPNQGTFGTYTNIHVLSVSVPVLKWYQSYNVLLVCVPGFLWNQPYYVCQSACQSSCHRAYNVLSVSQSVWFHIDT